MKNIIKSELDRMIKSKKNKWLFIISIGIFILQGFFIKTFNVGFYDPNIITSLNSLNTPPFIIREFHLFLLYVFCPMIFIESFNHENTSGGYRMVLIRGYKKRDYIISKLMCCVMLMAVFMVITYIVGTLFGYLFIDKTNATTYFNMEGSFGVFKAALYNFKFYGLEYLIVLAFLGISSIIGIISKNSVIAYFLSLGICIGSIYISDTFEFFLGSTKVIFDTLANMNNTFILSCIIIMVSTSVISILIFEKRDYLN